MNFEQLEVLEGKIKKLISALKNLQAENEMLTGKNTEAEKTIQQLRSNLDRWSKSAEENQVMQEQNDQLKKEREEVRSRVEALIRQIEDLETRLD